jgi:uncharacterized protein (DUF924 family)
MPTPQDIVAFWREAGPDRWFARDEALDAAIRERFLESYEAAARGDLNEWELEPSGSLALLLLLDQFPRHLFRGTRRAYATDATALLLAERAIDRGHDRAVEDALRRFFYTPFMHAEDPAAQERCVALVEALGDAESLHWARHHRDVVARFGRFPHRNATLGRTSTPEEERFLQEDEFRG